jgi:hypothetical protein
MLCINSPVLENKEANMFEPKQNNRLHFIRAVGPKVGTYNYVPAAFESRVQFFLDVLSHVFKVLQLGVVLHLVSLQAQFDALGPSFFSHVVKRNLRHYRVEILFLLLPHLSHFKY